MMERQVPGIKLDADVKDHKADATHNEIRNRPNKKWCKTENFANFYNE